VATASREPETRELLVDFAVIRSPRRAASGGLHHARQSDAEDQAKGTGSQRTGDKKLDEFKASAAREISDAVAQSLASFIASLADAVGLPLRMTPERALAIMEAVHQKVAQFREEDDRANDNIVQNTDAPV
jgi:hypothetical protein